ncbi:type VI secretion system contractile sheath small subunit [Vibrio parahaemolyticus]|uniref:type VI secretion system contractile sheath small subunit n=1 Tax=Vibrio harveyi group TaxID=717610 RepID=UPI000C86DBEE|nr:type VI secretion system contractile sheath small subunit [Vibrio parahaemolyticus]QLK44822.1 type VI secretion system contractile sheath small subunit [Vibrio owensii]AYO02903.1 type VI secretion system contractile sheath small subunit [Vibrio parahaemolyticus]EGQ7810720.1 type VI secretion system contractile sheath small subunit [Vibrio parahaemolyticus]EHK0753041.1 type VI secretion system contractile sheath small subunit [Vibrio parahaemolyticus]EHR5320098.1 type VI secretion system con
MSKEGSVAPKERINIKYIPKNGDDQSEVELPLKTLVVGDFKGHTIDVPLEERESVSVDKNNFTSVMRESELGLSFSVRNQLTDDEGAELPIELTFESLSDFAPDHVAQQVPELKKLIELREALVALKGPLGNIPAFRQRLQTLLSSDESREKLLKELELINPSDEPQK